MTTSEIDRLQTIVGHQFTNHELLIRAMTHASGVDVRLQSNERLEFLGDAVLGMVVCSHLFDSYPNLMEGELTKIKSTVVSRRVCAEIAKELKLDELLRLGKGMSVHAALPGSVLAAVFEAIIGAMYLDGGLEITRTFIMRCLQKRIDHAAQSGHQFNFKSVLQQIAQQQHNQTPSYIVLDEKGPDHAKCFEVCVELGNQRLGSCWGPSKKQAEQLAALQALVELGHATRELDGEVKLCRNGANASTPNDTAINDPNSETPSPHSSDPPRRQVG
ncbi:MAG TPA: ribonuclease III [Phycisphaerales bacterium]|nr:ribonuclease III [Phycisphaerales bacterium]